MKKVLMISYSFPPIAGGGVFRTLKFVKFLPNFGYDSVVLSVKKSKFKDFDETLLNAIPSTTNVYRAKNIESKIYRYAGSFFHINYKWYQIPDVFITWLPFALNKAKYIVKKEKPSVIYSTSPPATSHIIAMLLKKKTKLPWVADFRDPWTDNFIIKYPTKFHRKLEEKLEKKVLKLADKVILNTESNKDALLKKYPDINKEKFIVITNGYDLDDFENIELSKTNNFTIASVGSFYDEMNPRIFLDAIKKLLSERPSVKDDLRIIVAGHTDSLSKEMLDTFEFNDILDYKGYVSYKESIEIMVNSDVLLLILPPKNIDAQRVIAQRMFNYFAAKKSILGMVPNGETSEIIKKANAGIIVNPEDVEDVKNSISELYDTWKQNKLNTDINLDVIKQYDRKELTKKLAETFDEIII